MRNARETLQATKNVGNEQCLFSHSSAPFLMKTKLLS